MITLPSIQHSIFTYICQVLSVIKTLSFVLLFLKQRFILEGPIHSYIILKQFFSIHLFNCFSCLFHITILDKCISLCIACLAIEVEVQTLDLSEFDESIKDIIFLDLLMKIGSDKNPSLDGQMKSDLHFAGLDNSFAILL